MFSIVSIPGFFGGVSQQAPSMRLPHQVATQENCRSSLIDGLTKRFNTDFIKELEIETGVTPSNATTSDCFVQATEDAFGYFFFIVTGDATHPIEAYDLDGNFITISYDTGTKTYLTSGGTNYKPKTSIRAMSVIDTSFILNREVVVDTLATTLGGTYKGALERFEDLTSVTSPTDGDVYRIVGTDYNLFTSYYVKYDGTETVWEEWGKPGMLFEIDPATMPVKLIRTSATTATVSFLEWDGRIVGDEDTNPWPSFVGATLENLFFYQNRLCFLSQDNLICSRTGGYYDFFRGTVLDVLDDHPIDVSTTAAAKKVPLLYDAAVFDNSIILFSTTHQFALTHGGGILSPTTVSLTPTTAYETFADSVVIASGNTAFFVANQGQYASILEYFSLDEYVSNQAVRTTSQCPSYLPLGLPVMDSSNVLDSLYYHSTETMKKLYVYNYFWDSEEKVQSAWHTWVFSDDIITFFVKDVHMFLVQKDVNGKAFLTSINLDKAHAGTSNIPVYLDKLEELTGTYDSATDKTSFTPNFTATDTSQVVAVDSATGLALPELTHNTGTYYVNGDFSTDPVYIGEKYTAKLELSELYMKTPGNVKRALIDGVTLIRSLILNFENTGSFNVRVSIDGRADKLYEFTGVFTDVNQLNQVSLFSGSKRFAVSSNARNVTITIESDSYLPFAFQSGSYEVSYYTKPARRF